MYTSHVTLTPMKIKCCNATASKDASFSKAFCDTEPYHESHAFSNVYKHVHVIKVFEKIWENKSAPTQQHSLFVFQKLLDFINDRKYTYHVTCIYIYLFIILSC